MYRVEHIAAALLAVVMTAPAASAVDEERPEDIISSQIRKQGVACTPLKAEPDPAHSRPHLKAWILTCREGTWRVVLVPDMAARVERID